MTRRIHQYPNLFVSCEQGFQITYDDELYNLLSFISSPSCNVLPLNPPIFTLKSVELDPNHASNSNPPPQLNTLAMYNLFL